MPLLKEDTIARQKLKGDLSTILGLLDELEVNQAVSIIKWTTRKIQLYRDSVGEKRFSRLPNAMRRGDIVLCDFGVNIPPEFSDINTGKHFAVLWIQQGHNVIVFPITQRKPIDANPYTIRVGGIPGLSAVDHYVKLDAVRSVSLRRVSRIIGRPDGKIYSDIVYQKINEALLKLYIDKN